MDKKIEQLEKQIEEMKKQSATCFCSLLQQAQSLQGKPNRHKNYAVIHDYYQESLQNDQQTIQDLEKLQKALEKNQADALQHQTSCQ